MTPTHLIDVDADDAVAEALAKYRHFIRTIAGRLSAGDAEFAADLEQEAAIAIWQLDPTRLEDGDERYLRGTVLKRMMQVARNEKRARERDGLVD